MKKKFSVCCSLLLLIGLLSFFNLSCEVGLGDSVDTAAPVTSITYPPAGSVIRGKFILAGTCEDDKGVEKMEVVVKNNETGKTWTYTNANISKKVWKIELNEKVEENWTFPDGKYTVDVIGTDKSGRQSGKSSRGFEIDNTPPMFFISSPASEIIEKSTKYGSVLKVNGTITEDHSVKNMEISIFDTEKKLLDKWVQTNVEITGGTSVQFAKYDSANKEKETHKRYEKIYTAFDESGNQSYYCSIKLEDSAKEYIDPVYKDEEIFNNTTGNITTSLWKNDIIRDNLMSTSASAIANLEPTDIKSIWNGTYSSTVVAEEKITQIKTFLKENQLDTNDSQKNLAFTLNKNASPKYNFIGFDFTGTNVGSHKSSKHASIGFSATSGLNETTFYKKTLKIYLFGPFDKNELNDDIISEIYSNPVTSFDQKKESNQAVLLKNLENDDSASGTSCTIDLELPENIETGKYYILAASGEDTEHFEFVPNNNSFFGFVGQASGTPPETIVQKPLIDSIGNSEELLEFQVLVKSGESNIESVTYEAKVTDLLANNKEVGTITGVGTMYIPEGSVTSEKEKYFTFNLKEGTQSPKEGYTSCLPSEGCLYKYSVTVTGTDVPQLSSSVTRGFTIDKKKPEIKTFSVSKVLNQSESSAEYAGIINGKIKVSGSIEERNPSSMTLTITDGTKTETIEHNDNTSFEVEIDTNDYSDRKVITFTLSAKDSASNESKKEYKYFVDQSTDLPVITSSGNLHDSTKVCDFSSITKDKNIFGSASNNNFSVVVSDDDGLDVIYLKVYPEGSETLVPGDNKTTGYTMTYNELNKSTSSTVNYKVPSEQGKYKIEVIAYDIGDDDPEKRKSVTSTFYIGVYDNQMGLGFNSVSVVDTSSPSLVAINNNSVIIPASKQINVVGSLAITKEDYISSIKVYKMAFDNDSNEWTKVSSADSIYDFEKDRKDGKENSIKIEKNGNKVTWNVGIEEKNIIREEAEQRFLFVAKDIYENEAQIELICKVDDELPKVKILGDNENWKNNTVQTISVVVGDVSDKGYSSGIEKVEGTISGLSTKIEMNPGSLCDKDGNKNKDSETYGKYQIYSGTAELSEGENTISFFAYDNVGQKSLQKQTSIKIDTTAPQKTSLGMDSNFVKKTTEKVEISFDWSDLKAGVSSTSGIKTYEVYADQVTRLGEVSSSPADVSLSGLSDGSHKLYMKAVDNAGNASAMEEIGSLIIDGTAPSVQITSVGSKLNKKVRIAGSLNDANVDSTCVPSVYWRTSGSTDTWNSLTLKDFDGDAKTYSCDGSSWTAEFDTEDIYKGDGEKEIELYVGFTDKAGNTTNSPSDIDKAISEKSCVRTTVDQNADRPVIKFTNIRTKITDSEPNSINTNVVSGIVTDDDGITDSKGNVAFKLFRIYEKIVNGTPSNVEEEITVLQDGSWSVTMNTDTEKEGEKSWSLRIKDVNGASFNTGNESKLSRPYVTSKLDPNEIYDNTDAIKFKYDITAPVSVIKIGKGSQTSVETKSGSAVWDIGSTNLVLGGEDNYIWVNVDITETVGMGTNPSDVTLTLKGKDVYGNSKALTVNGTYVSSSSDKSVHTYNFYAEGTTNSPAKLSDFANGSLQVIVSTTDKAGNYSQEFRNITIDTEAPWVQILSPSRSPSDAVCSAIKLNGLVQDKGGSSIKSLKYMIPNTDAKSLVDAGKIPSNGWKNLSNSTTWEIAFASGSNESSDSLIYYATAKEDGNFIYSVSEVGTGTGTGIYKVPFYFLVEDSAGNKAVRTKDTDGEDLYVLVDSEGGKPLAWISSPENKATTSGSVTIYGGASDNVSVVKVELCINGNTSEPIEVTGTNSWKYTVDSSDSSKWLSENVDGKQINYMTFSVRAHDDDKQTREWTEPVKVIIDGQTPTIKNLKLVQKKADGSVNVEREYVSGMYISDKLISENGEWYLTADIEDNVSVSSIEWTQMSSTGQALIDINPENVNLSSEESKYKLNQKLDIKDKSGQIYYVIKVKDGDNGEQTQSVIINVDSTAPSFYDTNNAEKMEPKDKLRLKAKANDKKIGSETSSATVENNNGFFTFGDVVGESGSGLNCIAFYFKHIGSTDNTTGIYNPMVEKGNGTTAANLTAVSASAANGSVYINAEKLPGLYLTGTNRTDDSIIQHDSLKDNCNVRVGGLVKVGGVYSKIVSLDSSKGQIKISPTASTSFTTVEVIYAQVVDHMLTESISNDLSTVINDDGDEMCESISQLGSSYNWSASIDSSNIPDGPVEIYAVAIDNAGNTSYGYIATSVTNRRPRLAKVLLATDLNGNGKYDFNASSESQIVTSVDETKATANATAFGEFSYYSAINPVSGVSQSDVELDSSKFKVISGLAIVPEFVGGNGNIGYVLKQTDSKDAAEYKNVQKGSPVALMTKENLIAETTNKGAYALSNQVSEKGGLIITPTKSNIALTFWDSTDGTIYGETSQWAHLMIPVTLMTAETTKPNPKIAPFYWNESKDNSVYINKAIAGHIELEADLSESVINSYGRDPKVSGKVKVQGTIYDDVRLSAITANVFGTEFELSTYTFGSWSKYTAESNALVESFTVNSDEISQNGHTVTYTMVVNTEKLSTVTGLDKVITISAKDWKDNVSVLSSTQTTVSSNTNYYKMDIVPYVTEIVTRLSAFSGNAHSVYARTANGNYVVQEGEVIQFLGYNLGSNEAKVTIPGMTEKLLVTGTVNGSSVENTVTLTASSGSSTGATSGAIELTVNSIPVLNNLNKNNACGSYETVNEDDSSMTVYTDENYAHCYNRQPNGVNNNELTDDLSVDVWQFKEAARPVNGGAELVTMKINPKTGVPGFSYANSVLYFNMPAYNSNGNGESSWGADNKTVSGSQYSQIPVGMNYGGFSHNSFCFDDYGYSYGAAMCTDTQNAKASAFLQFFSRETPINYSKYDQNMNYANCANASRIDCSTMNLGYSSDENWQTNINRIQSISMDTSYSGGNTAPSTGTPVYVYMAYFDDITKQVRFRWGTVGDASDNIDGKDNSTGSDSFNSGRKTYAYGLNDIENQKYTGFAQGAKSDGACRPSGCDDSYIKYSYGNNDGIPVQVIAQGDITVGGTIRGAYKQTTTYKAGKYVSMGIVGKTTAVSATTSPAAVVFWSDGLKLYMAYNEKPTSSNSWTSTLVDSNGGLNVKCAVDSDGGIHVAYYTTNGSNLKYAYYKQNGTTASYMTTPSICTVDANGAVGTKCTIDVVKDSDGNQVPYISYQLIGGVSTYNAKVAYRKDFTSANFDGADVKDFYTGKWEISLVPTTSLLKDDTVNIGLWRGADGKAKNFTSNKNWKSADILSYGGTAGSSSFETVSNNIMAVGSPSIVYGNNTANPIIGYGVESGSIEMAQKK